MAGVAAGRPPVLFVADGNAFFIVDVHTKHARKIYSASRDVIGPPRLTRDGRTAYYSRRVTDRTSGC